MTDSASRALPYGTWPSPITAADVARQNRIVSFPLGAGGHVWWQERLPHEGGRTTVMRFGPDGKRRSLLAAPWNARTRVHEYGGRSYLPVPALPPAAAAPAPSPVAQSAVTAAQSPALLFANYADQRLYLAAAAGQHGDDPGPRPLTPAPPGTPGGPSFRFADFTLSHDGTEVWCVRERHEDGKVTRAIVSVPLDGSAAQDSGAMRELVTGADFYAYPALSPDGRRLAWVCWNHPRMPWDGTELRVALVRDGMPGKGGLVKGGIRESVVAPRWRDNNSLYVVSDWPGWWNLYQLGLAGEPAQALYPAEEEFADPLWQLGQHPFAVLSDGRLAVLHGCGGMRLGLLDPESGEMAEPDIPFEVFASGLSADGMSVVGVAGGPKTALAVIRMDAVTGKTEVLREETADLPDPEYLPQPRHVELEGKFGRGVHALVYPPTSAEAHGRKSERPPYVVWAHAGPTSHSMALFDLEKAYFTSRGIGVIDVNYGGSTGYGRSYRERLRMQWGVVDVEDVIAAARALADAGEADGARLAVRGAAAGGWTALAAVTTHAADGVFSAATSYYGVADLRAFASQTHDFESRYLDGLAGPLPGFDAVYAERSPTGHVTDASCPVLLLQGLDDPVVPPAHSQSFVAQLVAHGIRHAYLTFDGESHGFRRAETIITCLEAELSFYGQVFGFTPPGIPELKLATPVPGGS